MSSQVGHSTEPWVNARITVLIPLGVPVDADAYTKQEAVSEVIESLALPRDAVTSGAWEDCTPPGEDTVTLPGELVDRVLGGLAAASEGVSAPRAARALLEDIAKALAQVQKDGPGESSP